MRRALIATQLFFAALTALIVHNHGGSFAESRMFLAAIALIESLYLARIYREPQRCAALSVITSLVLMLLFAWELAAVNLKIANPILLPPPGEVFEVFADCRALMFKGVFSSLALLGFSMSTALVSGVILGLAVGLNRFQRDIFLPIAKVLSPVPPIIYSPYAVAVMPTFRGAAALIIVLGIFWPTFMGIINRASAMDRRIADSARALGLSPAEMIFHVMLPYLFPGIMSGLHVTLSTSFLLLTMAEMMGASSGLGYFIKNYSDYANYTNVIAGIILIGIVVSLLNALLSFAEKRLVKWKE
ncbi:ABC transporter permease [Cloacibacillus evryensis]|uniref:ABC transporter permease n=1 Tax=Cloacibacillus evryensis TaxID=508460 RepID=UPI00210ED34E|nr:ABC transporter permease subunit [Cloacibacillus evryensis]MCQ4764315.1 ABC transporter permease subunit [Cloacibacillus evryensis]